jgi:hypothetical protein
MTEITKEVVRHSRDGISSNQYFSSLRFIISHSLSISGQKKASSPKGNNKKVCGKYLCDTQYIELGKNVIVGDSYIEKEGHCVTLYERLYGRYSGKSEESAVWQILQICHYISRTI